MAREKGSGRMGKGAGGASKTTGAGGRRTRGEARSARWVRPASAQGEVVLQPLHSRSSACRLGAGGGGWLFVGAASFACKAQGKGARKMA